MEMACSTHFYDWIGDKFLKLFLNIWWQILKTILKTCPYPYHALIERSI